MATDTKALMENDGGGLSKATGWLDRLKNYVAELKAEMRRVTWPSAKQVRATTGVVIAVVFLFATYFFFVDYVLGRSVNMIFQSLAKR